MTAILAKRGSSLKPQKEKKADRGLFSNSRGAGFKPTFGLWD